MRHDPCQDLVALEERHGLWPPLYQPALKYDLQLTGGAYSSSLLDHGFSRDRAVGKWSPGQATDSQRGRGDRILAIHVHRAL